MKRLCLNNKHILSFRADPFQKIGQNCFDRFVSKMYLFTLNCKFTPPIKIKISLACYCNISSPVILFCFGLISERDSIFLMRKWFSFEHSPWRITCTWSSCTANLLYHMESRWFKSNIDIAFEYLLYQPASVAQLEARSTGDQEAADSIPTGSATFFRGDLIVKYFLRSFFPFRWFKKGGCQFLTRESAQNWLTT